MRTAVMAVLACILWSTAFAGIKIGLRHSDPLSFAGMRFMIAGLIIIPFCGSFINYLKNIKKNIFMIIKVAFFQTFMLYGLFYWGMTLVPGALGAIVVGASPLVTAIGAHYFMENDKINFRSLLIIFLGISGIAVISISRKPWEMKGLVEVAGVLLLLGGTISSTAGNIFVARESREIDPLVFNSGQIFIGGLLLFLVSLVIEGLPKGGYPAEFYGALAWLSFVSAAAFSLWFILLKTPGVKISYLNVWKFIIPVSGAVLSWIILPDEHPDAGTVSGMIIVALAIIAYNILSALESKKEKKNL